MKKGTKSNCKTVLIIVAIIIGMLLIIPFLLVFFDGSKFGNVALIPLEGVITTNGQAGLGQQALSSTEIVEFIETADDNPQVKAIVLEINSPGGSAVASDEIANAVKRTSKPTVALIRDVGASGGYWVASATDHIIANRMSITGSIGVISSYLEFSGLMEKYGVKYERLVAGEYKDSPTPYRKLEDEERELLQKKLDKIHKYFIEEIAVNRNLDESKVKQLSTGEFYLGVEALELGLIDQVGDKETVKEYLTKQHNITDIDFIVYETKPGLLDLFTGVFSEFFFNMGEGFGYRLTAKNNLLLT